jgi:hypothetical protein
MATDSVGHTSFMGVKVELTCVQDLGSSPQSSRRLPINTSNISYRTKATQNKLITDIDWLLWPTVIFYYKSSVG